MASAGTAPGSRGLSRPSDRAMRWKPHDAGEVHFGSPPARGVPIRAGRRGPGKYRRCPASQVLRSVDPDRSPMARNDARGERFAAYRPEVGKSACRTPVRPARAMVPRVRNKGSYSTVAAIKKTTNPPAADQAVLWLK